MYRQKKIVLYTQRVELIDSYKERRDCADQRISDFIFKSGYLPIALPNNREIVEEIIEELQPAGIILTGGNSLIKYGGNAVERDETDDVLIKKSMEKALPLYGFCRGMQSILNYFSNELIEVDGHVAKKHNVSGKINDKVNSYHNQACIELNEESCLMVLAKSDDGVIEAIRHKEYPIIGTMWHPEREEPYRDKDIQRMKELFG